MKEDCYRVLPVKEIEQRLMIDSIKRTDFDTCLLNTGALVFFLKSGETAMIPGSYDEGAKGILFDKKECYLSCLEKDYFPIENSPSTLEEEFQSDILQIDQKIPDIFASLSNLVKHPAAIDSNDDMAEILKLMKAKNKIKKLSRKEFFYTSMILSEYVRRAHNGKWILLKTYGSFNPYYTVGIIYPDKSIFYIRGFSESYFKFSSMTPELFVNVPYIRKPSLLLENAFFKANFFGYKIL